MKYSKELHSKVRNQAKNCGIPVNEVRPFILRVYARLNPKSHSAIFDFRETTKVIERLEKTLAKTDLFFSNGEIALGVHKVTLDNPGNSNIYFYGDRLVFAGGIASTAAVPATGTTPAIPANIVQPEFSAIELLYNSELSLKTGSMMRLERYDTSAFRHVPMVQESGTSRASGGIHFVDFGANFIIQGGLENRAEITFDGIGDKTNIGGGTPTENFAVILMPGFLVKGGADNPKFVEYAKGLQQA